jgi:hypothetical protein
MLELEWFDTSSATILPQSIIFITDQWPGRIYEFIRSSDDGISNPWMVKPDTVDSIAMASMIDAVSMANSATT